VYHRLMAIEFIIFFAIASGLPMVRLCRTPCWNS
jgi:hypothetical protein